MTYIWRSSDQLSGPLLMIFTMSRASSSPLILSNTALRRCMSDYFSSSD